MVTLVGLCCALLLTAGLWFLVVPSRVTRRHSTVRRWIDEAGLSFIPISFIAFMGVTFAVVVGGVTWIILPIPVLAPLAGLVGVGLPVLGLVSVRTARRVRAEARWGDVIDALRMSLRAGASLTDAFAQSISHVPAEWRQPWSEANIAVARGGEIERVFREFQRAMADPIADRLVESLLIARDAGGTELPVVLGELAHSVRHESGFRREARSRQSWVRNAARLGVFAPWVVLALLASRPENREAYATPAGSVLLAFCAVATAGAYAMMSSLARLRHAPRWLVKKIND